MLSRTLLLACAILLVAPIHAAEDKAADKASADDAGKNPTAVLHVQHGDEPLGTITLELDLQRAPITTANFIQYARDDFFDETVFHRVIPGFVIQGGGYSTEMRRKEEGLRPGIINEWQNQLKNKRGTICMARVGNNELSATSQFFINLKDNAPLDQPRDGAAYAVFGRVTDGMDVVDKIAAVETEANPMTGEKSTPVDPPVVTDVKLNHAPDASKLKEITKQARQEFWKKRLREFGVKQASGDLTRTDEDIRYEILKRGDGPSPDATDSVRAHYTGWLVNGKKFDSSRDRGQPATFPLQGVIKGWTIMLSDMKVGERRVFVLPPELSYGPRGRPGIPGNSPLVFDVELLGVE
jgi:FKBP-type peptidyl-prolyl cis-trans isomerase